MLVGIVFLKFCCFVNNVKFFELCFIENVECNLFFNGLVWKGREYEYFEGKNKNLR